MESGLFADGALTRTGGGVVFEEGLCIRPAVVTEAWLEGCERIAAAVTRLEPTPGGWRLQGESGPVAEAELVMIAAGPGSGQLMGAPSAFTPVRGQASWAEGISLDRARAWGGYACPMAEDGSGGVLFGATHDRGRTDVEVLAEDHARNLKALAEGLPELAARAAGRPLKGRAAIRATTFDRMPVADSLEGPGLHLLGGLGSRGFCTAPLLAEHLAAKALGRPSPLPVNLQGLMLSGRLQKS
jgi:tRNA 5-methylaminomethyl-2-thiouridine biosynthesis bifunctional protein